MLTQVVSGFRPPSYIILMQVATVLMNFKSMNKVAGNREMFDENSTPGSWVLYSCIQLPPWRFFLNVLYSSQIPYKINKLQRELSLIFSIPRNDITTYTARSKPKVPLLSSYLPHKSCWLELQNIYQIQPLNIFSVKTLIQAIIISCPGTDSLHKMSCQSFLLGEYACLFPCQSPCTHLAYLTVPPDFPIAPSHWWDPYHWEPLFP